MKERVGAFRYTKVLPIKELQATLVELEHEPTGAKVVHLACDDKENVFSLSFQTLPYNSNGVAHILEHTTLCGSKKFPVKDPFFSLNRRSLNTFMNAFTGPDFTCYPAASQIEQDFYNILEVYLDAVFYPTLDEKSFLQEGHRLEFEKPDDPSTPLVFRGIVFNEMKGALTNADARFWHGIMENLVPDLPYAHNSGGDPKDIPSLTYEQLKEFHAKYYHPSHAIFYFYGNLPLEKHLAFIEKHALTKVKKKEPLPPIAKQKRFEKPRTHTFTYPDSGSGKTYFALSWLTAPLTDQQDALALAVLDSVLMDTDASPLKAAILESKLCTTAEGYIDLEMSEIPYSIICRDSEPEHAEKLEHIIIETLKRIAKDGIPPHLVDAAIHHLEFARTEITGEHYPFGLTLFLRSVLAKQHGCDTENALLIHSQFEKLLKLIEEPRYFNNLIEKYFINNPHRITLTMTPDTEQAVRDAKAEKAYLAKIKESLTDADPIIKQAKMLEEFQNLEQPVDCLPKIHISDVPRNIPTFPLKTEGSLSYHPCFTNHILYAEIVFDLPELTKEELQYAKLLTSLFTDLGAGKRDYRENLEYIHAKTGGVETSIAYHPNPTGPSKPTFSIRGKALDRNIEHLFTIFEDTLTAPRLDEKERIGELILQIDTHLQNRLQSNPMGFAITLAASGITSEWYITYLTSGLPYVSFIHDLAQNFSNAHVEKLQAVAEKLLHLSTPHIILSCDEHERKNVPTLTFSSKPFTPWSNGIDIEKPESQIRLITTPVAFTAHSLKTIPLTHSDSAAISVATHLLENTGLHKKIREQGGAYGSGASYDHCAGEFHFHAYRDPHIKSSLDAFRETTQALVDGKFTPEELIDAKLGLVQSLDHPVSPGNRAMTTFSFLRDGKTDEVRQAFRDRMLALTPQQLSRAVATHINFDQGTTVILTGEELAQKEALDLPTSPV